MKPGPQSDTFHAGHYRLPQRPARVSGRLVGIGIVLMCAASLRAAAALAVAAMQPK